MWALSRNSEWGRVTATRDVFASVPALGEGQFRLKRWVTGVMGGTGDPGSELGGEGEGAAVGDLKRLCEVCQ